MLQVDIISRVRTTFGKGAARTLRRAGQTPGIVYGPKLEPLALEMNTKDLTKALLSINRKNAVINLDIDDGKEVSKRHVMTKEIQTDPVQDVVIHADFCEVLLDKPMTLSVPIKYTGKAKGVDMGGDLQIAMNEISLKGKVFDIPDYVEINISSLGVGDRLTCKDIAIPDTLALQGAENAVCVSVTGSAV